ncbi:MAG: hypothetical protein MUO43_04895 [Desulfobacterales bacterium]|nr:hypothetical protein [Desulfobacterales bacterium]
MIKRGKSDRLIRNGENNIQNLEKILELMEEAAQCGFDVPSDWILKLKIEKRFFIL